MPKCQIPGTNTTYWLVSFNKAGDERTEDGSTLATERILTEAKADPPSHVFLFSHGWKGDLGAARDQYDKWIGAMAARTGDVAKMGEEFRPLYIGLHWPSLPFGQEKFEAESFAVPVAAETALDRYVDFFEEGNPEVRLLLEAIFAEHRDNAGAVRMPKETADQYRRLAEILEFRSGDLDAAPDADGREFDPVAAFDITEEAANFGDNVVESGLLSPLRQLSFWIMKKRARTVGEGGMYKFISDLQTVLPEARFQLMGHSFGCIVVSGVLGGPKGKEKLPRPVDSLVLVQGAVSLWAYADNIMHLPKTGYFHTMIRRPSVRGPIVTTRSAKDYAVGVAYPLAVGLAAQISFGLKLLPPFGGIGSFGIQGFAEATDLEMRTEDQDYRFEAGKLYNLDATAYIRGHCDIAGPQVAHTIWQAASV
jgi:hypothetical protein